MLLRGIKILDLSTLLPGPMCSLFFADLGADVIKVESLSGDLIRRVESGNKSAYFSALNRNKKSIALNLKTNEGKDIFIKLARDADVIIEGFRPGKVDSLGIGYNNIKKVNPKIIYCSITGYGQKGPYKKKAGHDLNYSSLSGLLDLLSNKPFVPGIQFADTGSALVAAFAIIAALLNRERNQQGNYIDISIFHSALSLISIHIAHHSLSNKKTVLSGSKPCYNVYETKDGRYVSLGAIENKFWQSFCFAANRKDLLRKQFDDSAIKDLKILFNKKTMCEWLKLNEKYDFCCEPVKKIEEVINDKYLNSKKILIQLDGIKQVAMPLALSSFEKMNYTKPPKLGQHTARILHSIGYENKAIKSLKIKGIIK